MIENIREESKDILFILKKIKNRNFQGNSGTAIKNTVYQTAYTFVSKVGSLLFTIILARVLMPELFGLYSLALSTILLFSYFSDLGINNTLVRFVSKEMSNSRYSKARAYTSYLLKAKLLVISGIVILFLVLAQPLSVYYQKPIFTVLIAGVLYLFSISLASFFQGFFQSLNDFRIIFIRESFFQFMRLILVPLLVIYLLSKAVSGQSILVVIFASFGILWGIMTLFLYTLAKKTPLFLAKERELNIKEKRGVNLFLKSILLFSIFSLVLTYSDIFILGGFVTSEYIGYYQAAMGIIGSLSTMVLFSGSLLPVFSRLKGRALERGFKKSLKVTITLSAFLFVGSILLSEVLINLLYGTAYAPAIPFFRGLCFLLILSPLTTMYNGYFIAKGEPEVIRNLLVYTSIFNFILNFSLVYYFSHQSAYLAVMGLIFGTIFSNLLYLAGCIWKRSH